MMPSAKLAFVALFGTLAYLGLAVLGRGGVAAFFMQPALTALAVVAIQPGHTLVTGGVYGVIRHPSYLGRLVNSVGWALAFRSGVGLVLTGLLVPPLLARIHSEETLLREHFGDAYDAYCSRTWRLIPGIY